MNKAELLAELNDFTEAELAIALRAAKALQTARAESFYFMHYFLDETFEVSHWDAKGECTITMPLTEVGMNPGRMAHGGVLALLCDNAMGLACHLQSERSGVTVELSVHYHKPARGKMLQATGRVISAGVQLLTAHCEVRDEHETLVATGMGTFYHKK